MDSERQVAGLVCRGAARSDRRAADILVLSATEATKRVRDAPCKGGRVAVYHREAMSIPGPPGPLDGATSPGLPGAIRAIGKLAIVFAVVLAVSATCITSGGTTEVREAEFSVVPGALVSADADNAAFTVRVGSAGIVRVSATLRNPSYVNYYVSPSIATTPAPDVLISAHVPDVAATRASSAIELEVPPDVRLVIKTTNGAIRIEGGLIGGGELATTEGDIALSSAAGTYIASTTNGNVTLEDVEGTFRANTTSGSVQFSGVVSGSGASRLETGNGNIEVLLKDEPDLQIRASNENGPIRVDRQGLHDVVELERSAFGTYGAGSGKLLLMAALGSIDVRR